MERSTQTDCKSTTTLIVVKKNEFWNFFGPRAKTLRTSGGNVSEGLSKLLSTYSERQLMETSFFQ